MTSIGAGGGRRTASLNSGGTRGGTLSAGADRRQKTINTPVYDAIGRSNGVALAGGVSDLDIVGDRLLQEDDFALLQEDGASILLENSASTLVSAGSSTASAVGASFVDRLGRVVAGSSVAGVLEAPNVADNILLENGDDLLLEDGSFLLLETGVVVPPTAILDVDSFAITDTDGAYILEP